MAQPLDYRSPNAAKRTEAIDVMFYLVLSLVCLMVALGIALQFVPFF